MIINLLYALNVLLLLSNFLLFRIESNERRFSFSMVQALLALPILIGLYAYLGFNLKTQIVPLLLLSENVFALTWFFMAFRLERGTAKRKPESRISMLVQICVGFAVAALSLVVAIYLPPIQPSDNNLAFEFYGSIYICSLFLLLSVLAVAWHLERFWRALAPARRWSYRFLVIGSYLVCGAIAWATTYRIAYSLLNPNHFRLLAALLFLAWLFMCYAVARHRLLNRKIFISRKIVYSFVAPILFAAYLLVVGIVSFIIRTFELPLPFVLRWLFLALGLVAVGLFAISGKLRRRIYFFISTHFYVNKYEYRDEWLALSGLLQGALTEADVVASMRQILTDSLYTTNIIIWLGDSDQGYRTVFPNQDQPGKAGADAIAPNDPLVQFLQTHPYFDVNDKEPDKAWKAVMKTKEGFLTDLELVLTAPLFIGDQLIGLIGLGPEFTGGRYGHDDFDLLIAIGTQAASALMAVRMAEELAAARERQAWDKLSAFVLHDIKNAANMLSLAKENAPNHIQNPQFQQDLLETVDDALGRMNKVQDRLGMLKLEVMPEFQDMELCGFLEDLCEQLEKKLKVITIALDCRTAIQLNTDPKFLVRIMENLLLNAIEAGGDGTEVRINATHNERHGQAVIEVTDSGPGIPPHVMPDALFEPYQTTKPGGSGIGLWHVRQLMKSLNGTISAENIAGGGARFILRLPRERARTKSRE